VVLILLLNIKLRTTGSTDWFRLTVLYCERSEQPLANLCEGPGQTSTKCICANAISENFNRSISLTYPRLSYKNLRCVEKLPVGKWMRLAAHAWHAAASSEATLIMSPSTDPSARRICEYLVALCDPIQLGSVRIPEYRILVPYSHQLSSHVYLNVTPIYGR
jgi:hypothetical protein